MKFNLIKRNNTGELKPADKKTGRLADPGYQDACYYVRFSIAKKSYCRSTGWTVQDDAEKAARDIYNKCLKESLAASMGIVAPKVVLPAAAGKVPTVADLCAFYLAAPGHAQMDTRTANASQVLKALERAHPDNEDVGSLPHTAIDGQLAITWFETVQKTNLRMAHDQTTCMHNRNTANANFIKIASLFTEPLLEQYEKAGYTTTGFVDFRKQGKNRRFKKAVSTGINPYCAPERPVIERMLSTWLSLEDRNVFIAAGFALAFGLRKGETMQVRWSWLRPLNEGYPGLTNGSDNIKVKGGHGTLRCRALEPYYSQFMARLDAMGWRGEPNDLVIAGGRGTGVAELETLCWERLGKWLKSIGWTTDKMSHALRAYSGSKVFLRYGLDQARKFLRHAKSDTTRLHYMHFASDLPMADDEVEEMPEHFAPRPKSNILPMVAVAA